MRDIERETLISGAKEIGMELPDARAEVLLRLIDALELANAQFNLTAIRDREGMLRGNRGILLVAESADEALRLAGLG